MQPPGGAIAEPGPRGFFFRAEGPGEAPSALEPQKMPPSPRIRPAGWPHPGNHHRHRAEWEEGGLFLEASHHLHVGPPFSPPPPPTNEDTSQPPAHASGRTRRRGGGTWLFPCSGRGAKGIPGVPLDGAGLIAGGELRGPSFPRHRPRRPYSWHIIRCYSSNDWLANAGSTASPLVSPKPALSVAPALAPFRFEHDGRTLARQDSSGTTCGSITNQSNIHHSGSQPPRFSLFSEDLQ
jgi:hypothetical protein